MKPFLHGPTVGLHATDALAPAGPGAWLDAGPQGMDEILMEGRALADGRPLLVVGLAGIDWIHRTATLCAGRHPAAGAPAKAPASHVAEALGLVLRYAVAELALETLHAEARQEEVKEILRAYGFRETAQAGGFLSFQAPDPLAPP